MLQCIFYGTRIKKLNLIYEELNSLADVQLNQMINQPIIHEEVIKGISMLKNNKDCGNDKIYNEYIKNTQDFLLNLYTGSFNKVFDTGMIPTQWACEFIKTKVLEPNPRTIDPLLY